ncbi:hypothetical protein HDV02_000483 [Globomyces sp. JEL0801]|nr:hypothetical protein HDV02_000483 [Globomyces sp. JEL0801]
MTKPKLKVSTFIPKKLNAERFHLFEKKQLVDSRSTESNTATEKSFTQVVTNTQVDEINIALKNVTPLNSSMSSVRSDLKVSPPNTPFSVLSSRTVNDVVKASSVVSLEKALIPVAITAASQLPTIELDQLETNAQVADIKALLDESSANCGLVDTNKFQELKNYVLPEIAVTPLDLPMILIAPVSTALNAPAVKAGQITPEVEYPVSTPNVDELLVPESVSLSYPSVVPTATVENYWQNVKIDALSTQLVKHDPVRMMLV